MVKRLVVPVMVCGLLGCDAEDKSDASWRSFEALAPIDEIPIPIEGSSSGTSVGSSASGSESTGDGPGSGSLGTDSTAASESGGDEGVCEAEELDDDIAIEQKADPPKTPKPPKRIGECSNNVTDSDGKNPAVAGCLTYYEDSQCANPIGFHWDYCVGNDLTEFWTGAQNKTACGSRRSLTRDCEDWIPGSTCQNVQINCGGGPVTAGRCVLAVVAGPIAESSR